MLFGSVVLLSAWLLFQVQLIVAKHLLPWFGGTPAVWTTSQMFFQVVLLCGYGYAHAVTRMPRARTQYVVHLGVLAAAGVAVFAMAARGGQPLLAPVAMHPTAGETPVLHLLLVLVVSVGLPFFALATTAPLLQRWHARHAVSLDATYRLYALSNIGSFLGLLSYPVLVERLLDLRSQAWTWAGMFLVFAAGCAIVARQSAAVGERPAGAASVDADAPVLADGTPTRPAASQIVAWVLLSAVGSVAFLATTSQLTYDVAAVPFLWTLPLAVYLLTFVVSFDRPRWYSRRWMPVAAAVASIAVLSNITYGLTVPLQVAVHLGFLFTFCMVCHGEIVRLRPGAAHLTLFYLLIATGGAIGGLLVSIVAPLVFEDFLEFLLVVPAGWLALALAWSRDRTSPFHQGDRWVFASVVAIVLFMTIRYPLERMHVGSWLSRHGWTVTLVAAVVLAAGLSTALWRTRLASARIWPRALVVGVLVVAGFFVSQRIRRAQEGLLYASRNFYGVVRVEEIASESLVGRQLMHGTTVHGVQVEAFGRRPTPTAYYSPSSGIALASSNLVRSGRAAGASRGVHFGVVGMGVGTMTAFAGEGDRVRYYEINPDVIDVARGQYFTYLRETAADVAVVTGDARLSLEQERDQGHLQRFDLLALDAFSSDAIPMHLMTREAFRLYAAHLNGDRAILAVNVTNRYVDLEPVVASHARALGFSAVRVDSPGDPPVVVNSSWILLSRDPWLDGHPTLRRYGARPLADGDVSFTDRYSNLFRVLK